MQDYPEFLQLFFTPLITQLTSTQPQFEDSELQKLRHGVLEVFAKLPVNDAYKPYLPQLVQVGVKLRGCVGGRVLSGGGVVEQLCFAPGGGVVATPRSYCCCKHHGHVTSPPIAAQCRTNRW